MKVTIFIVNLHNHNITSVENNLLNQNKSKSKN